MFRWCISGFTLYAFQTHCHLLWGVDSVMMQLRGTSCHPYYSVMEDNTLELYSVTVDLDVNNELAKFGRQHVFIQETLLSSIAAYDRVRMFIHTSHKSQRTAEHDNSHSSLQISPS